MRSQLPAVLLQAKYTPDEANGIKERKRLWSSYCNILLMRCTYCNMLVMSIYCNTLVIRSIYCNMLVISNKGYLFGFILHEGAQSFTDSSTHEFDTLSPSHMLVRMERVKKPFISDDLPSALVIRSIVLWKSLKFCKPKKLFCSAQKARACFSVSYSLKCQALELFY